MQPKEPPKPSASRAVPTTRLPYEAPRIVEAADFETLALACTKAVIALCPGGRFNS